jgi:hypothetical protein
MAVSLADLAEKEVVALHAFFVGWFRGVLQDADFTACERALAADFTMVTPDGEAHDRDAVLERLYQARGTRSSTFEIEILAPRRVWSGDSAVLLEYVEQQYLGGRSTRRRSTGLFSSEPSAPRGVLWRHLQETWMDAEPGTITKVLRTGEGSSQ